jgi:NAD-dependent dihydropyrimidine dehydrogenase PreA subunit
MDKIMSERFEVMEKLLADSKYFKLVCGAGNENPEEVHKLAFVYTLAGAKGFDVAANPSIVTSCLDGINKAFDLSKKFSVSLQTRPFITVSVGMPGDHHVRKSEIHLDECIKCNLCIPVCPTDAIPDSLVVIEDKCIGCGTCSAVCPKQEAITYRHNERALEEVLPKCLEAGAEHIELHAAIAEDDTIMEEWSLVNRINTKGHNSMCLDRLHLSNFAFEERVRKAHAIAGDRLIIQSDGYPMSGGVDDYNTTLQAVATADVLNKAFNMMLRKSNNTLIYTKRSMKIKQLLSGGTNSLTAELANNANVRWHGVSLGTFARNLIKDEIQTPDFDSDFVLQRAAVEKAHKLIVDNIGQPPL